MKKRLFLLLIITIFSFNLNVKAEEFNECFNDFLVGNVSFKNNSNYWKYLNPRIPVKSNTTYYLRFFINEDFTSPEGPRFSSSPIGYDSEGKSLGFDSIKDYSWDSNLHIFTFTTSSKENVSSLLFQVYTYKTNYTILENSYFIISDDIKNVTSCSVVEKPDKPIDPSNPDIATPQETDQSKIFSNFYTLFLDRLKFISNYATKNYLFLGFIAVIISFVLLNIFLFLFNRGGYKR
uniref:Uncharacterized protein n=1 Tax=Dulem virus 59 TaxID=3145770 RepID=A0AAU8B5P7_9VIRU